MKILVLLLCIIRTVFAVEDSQTPRVNYTPIILWHGMGDTCCLPISAGLLSLYLQQQLRGAYLYSMVIGNDTRSELENGYFMNPNAQVEYACKRLKEDDVLKKANGFNMIGLGQGSILLRAVIQRCGHELPPVKSFISLGGPHQGISGLPRCMSLSHETCDSMQELLKYAPYHRSVQHTFVPATYWHDPHEEEEYKYRSIFLSDINNEVAINDTYRSNLMKLEHLVLVKFDYDTVLQPRESAWFGYHAPGHEVLQTLQQSALYLEDRLGLREMDKAGKLVFLSHPSDHIELEESWVLKTIMPYLVDNQNNIRRLN